MSVIAFHDAKSSAPPKMGEWLCREGHLTADQLRLALHDQKTSHDLLGRVLLRLHFVKEQAVLKALEAQTGHAIADLRGVLPDADALELADAAACEQFKAVPLALENNVFTLALSDPFDVRALDYFRRVMPKGAELALRLAGESDVAAFITRAYDTQRNFGHWLSEMEQAPLGEAPQPVVEAVQALLEQAVAAHASDIHLEPEAQSVRVRIRIDGTLQVLTLLHRSHWPMMAQRLKVMAGMDIVDTRNIQDGRFNLTIDGQAVDFRVSILPTQHGENIVIRVLDQRRALQPLEQLGFSNLQEGWLRRLIQRPEGMLLITGPTGSGKTTTLYALLQLLNNDTKNLMTLEDPIEYMIPRVRQTQVREQHQLGFADGVRAILRQDPDVVLIGEIRDPDTAQMGLRTAMTGNQVFATLHTKDCFGVFPRLREFGISPGLMAGHIIGSVAQRLVRELCPQCKDMREPNAEERAILKDCGVDIRAVGVARGCAVCGNTGYKGRVVISEILPVDGEVDDLIARGAGRAEMRSAAKRKGFVSLQEDGLAKLEEGRVSLQALMAKVDLFGARDDAKL